MLIDARAYSAANIPMNLRAFLLHSDVPGNVAQWLALIPLAWLAILYLRGLRPGTAWWLLAGAFAVSWLADEWARHLPKDERYLASLVYPVSQTALIGAVLLPKRIYAWILLGALVLVGLVAAWLNEPQRPDMLLRTFAWFAVLAVILFRPELPRALRGSLFSYFGVGWVAWAAFVGYQHEGEIATWIWYLYHLSRLFGLLLFCQAAVRPYASLEVVAR